jgi:hypothetical protein
MAWIDAILAKSACIRSAIDAVWPRKIACAGIKEPDVERIKTHRHRQRRHEIAPDEVGLLFIFIIMLMFFALQYRETERQRKQATEQLVNAEQVRDEILEDLQHRWRERGINVQIVKDQGILRLPEAILFDKTKADINQRGDDAVAALAEALAAIPPCYTLGPPTKTEGSCQPPLPDRRGRLPERFRRAVCSQCGTQGARVKASIEIGSEDEDKGVCQIARRTKADDARRAQRRAVDASAADDFRARHHGLLGPSCNPVGLARRDERADLGFGQEGIADPQGLHARGEASRKARSRSVWTF